MRKISMRTRILSAALSLFMVMGIVNIPIVEVKADVTAETVSDWSSLKSKVTDLDAGGEINLKLAGTLTPPGSGATITIDSGKKVTVDLNGHDIVRQAGAPRQSGSLFTVTGSSADEKSRLTITDTSSVDSSAKITGTHQASFNGSVIIVDKYGEFYLEKGSISDNSGRSHGAGVSVTGGTFVMQGGAIVNNTAYATGSTEYRVKIGCGGGVYISASDDIPGSFVMNGGKIWGNGRVNDTNKASDGTIEGAGVYVGKGCSFEMNGGSFGEGEGYMPGNIVQSSNLPTAVKRGANVYVAGTFHMNGGKMVAGETTSNNGGGIYIADGGDFIMDGGEITDALSCGVYVDSGANFTMNGGTLKRSHGAGVYVNGESDSSYGTFTLTGGTITANGASEGGGVHVQDYAEFTMTGGSIDNNLSTTTGGTGGGGVYVGSNGRFYMKGGSISDNRAQEYGAGVYVDDEGKFYLSKGQIKDNTISVNTESYYGAGLYLNGSARVYLSNDGVITVSGNKNVNDDNPREDNIVIGDKNQTGTFIFQEKIAEGSELVLGFNLLANFVRQTITEGYDDFYGDASPDEIFKVDQDGVIMRINEGEVQVYAHTHSPFYDNSKEDRVTVSCRVTDSYNTTSCGMTGAISISVPNPYYTGNPVLAKLTVDGDYEELTGLDVDESKIQYFNPNDLFNPLSDIPSEKGWYAARYKLGVDGSSVSVTTYYEIRDCELVFKANGHGYTPDKQTLASGSLATKPEDPQATRWAFGGWYTDPDCSEGNLFDFATPVTGDMTLYAKWSRCDHDGTEATYTWADDGSSCYALYKCAVCGFKEEENGKISSEPVKAATCSEKGETKYTATFTNTTYFTTDTKVIADIPIDDDAHVWGQVSYSWADDNSSCTASRKCTLDETHVDSEDAEVTSKITIEPTATEEGTRLYTATFTKDCFVTQYETVTIPQLKACAVHFVNVIDDTTWDQLITEGNHASQPAESMTSDEYTFAGWYKDMECTEAFDLDNDPVTDNITLYAKWIHTHEDGMVFTAWSSTNSMPSKSGSYILINDVNLSSSWNVGDNRSTEREISICLNGKNIMYLAGYSYPAIKVWYKSVLSIYDCSDEPGIIKTNGGKGTNPSPNAAIIVLNNNVNPGTLKLYNGKISGSNSRGVVNEGYFLMYGGEISDNEYEGVYVYNGTFGMYGGTISGNNGSGVVNSGTFNMAAGSIVNNKQRGCYPRSVNIVELEKGSGKAGKITIKDNGWANVYFGNSKINIKAQMTEDSLIGITILNNNTPSMGTAEAIKITNGFHGNATLDNFFWKFESSGMADVYDCTEFENELAVKYYEKIEYVPGAGSGETIKDRAFWGDKITLPECTFTAPEGYQFDHWETTGLLSGKPGDEITIDRSYTGDLAIEARWARCVTVDFGEGHEDLVAEFYGKDGSYSTSGKYLYEGSKVYFPLDGNAKISDAYAVIDVDSAMTTPLANLDKIGGFALKPISGYKGYDELNAERNTYSITDFATSDVFYALWYKSVGDSGITVTAPVCGTEVVAGEDLNPMQQPMLNCEATGDIIVFSDVAILVTSQSAFDPTTDDYDQLFRGTIKGGQNYSIAAGVYPVFGYYFDDSNMSKITVNGKTPGRSFRLQIGKYDLVFLTADVEAEHIAGDGVIENDKPAACGIAGSYDEVTRCTICGDKLSSKTTTRPALEHNWSDWKVTKKADVNIKGEETRECSLCGKKETRDIAAIEPTATPTTKPSATPTKAAEPTKASTVTLKLNKTKADVVCGKTLTLKATLTGSDAKISWKSSDKKVATVDASGKITAKQAGTVTITASAAGKKATCTVTVLYSDVTNAKDFWFNPTNYMTAAGVVKGYDKQTKFKPANVCTRAQMVTFIWRLVGQPKPKTATCKFSDVKKTDYFYQACIWGNEKHIVEGYKDGTFGPQIVCARRHAVTFLWRLAGKPDPKTKTNKFKDLKSSDYFYKATLWASETKILEGYDDGTFRPNGSCLRRQMVTFLYKYDKFVNGKG